MTSERLRNCLVRVGRLGGWVLSIGLVIGCADKEGGNNGGGGGDGDDTTDSFDYAGCEAALEAMRDCYLVNSPGLTEEELEIFNVESDACDNEESDFRSVWSTSEDFECVVEAYDGLDCTVDDVGASRVCF